MVKKAYGEVVATVAKKGSKEVILSVTDFENLIKYIRYLEDTIEKLNREISDYNRWIEDKNN